VELGCCLDDPIGPSKGEIHLASQVAAGREDPAQGPELLRILGLPSNSDPEDIWDSFLNSFGDLLLKTATYSYRRYSSASDSNDATMDAYAFILEKLRQDDLRRLRGFSGGDEVAFSRWLVVVARRLCTDFWRHRYGRVRPSTPTLERDARRRLVDEIWDPRDSSELPTPRTTDPEWELRYRERRQALEAALDGLEPRDQLLLAVRFEEGLSARKISDLMGFPSPFHVYRQLNRVLKVMKERLEGGGVDEADP